MTKQVQDPNSKALDMLISAAFSGRSPVKQVMSFDDELKIRLLGDGLGEFKKDGEYVDVFKEEHLKKSSPAAKQIVAEAILSWMNLGTDGPTLADVEDNWCETEREYASWLCSNRLMNVDQKNFRLVSENIEQRIGVRYVFSVKNTSIPTESELKKKVRILFSKDYPDHLLSGLDVLRVDNMTMAVFVVGSLIED